MDHCSWNVSHAQTEIQRPHTEAIFTKINNYGDGYKSCLLPRSLSIAVDHDLLGLLQGKKTLRPIPQLFQRSKVVSRSRMILAFFYSKRCRLHVMLKVEREAEGRRSSFCPPLIIWKESPFN